MKKTIKVLRVTSLFLFSLVCLVCLAGESNAEYWEKVADKGFGDPSNDYAWSMTTFQGRLYVGTLNLLKGADIWRSRSGEPDTWERVYNSRSGTLSNAGIRYLYTDGDQALYACASSLRGAEILRTANGRSWIPVGRGGMGNWKNNSIRCMVRFKDYLYGGIGNNGAELCRSKDGFTWRLVKTDPAFQSTKVLDPDTNDRVINNLMIGELAVFNDQLYAFTWAKDVQPEMFIDVTQIEPEEAKDTIPQPPGAFEIWRSSDGVVWERVVGQNDKYGNGMGFSLLDPKGLENDIAISTAVFKDQLYVGTQNSDGDTSIWRTSDGTEWEKVLSFFDLGEKFNFYVWRMFPYKERLYVGTLNIGPIGVPGTTGAQIWVSDSGDTGTFHKIINNGFDGVSLPWGSMEIPKNYGIRCFGVLNDTLFAGTATIVTIPITSKKDRRSARGTFFVGQDAGCEIWKLVP